MVYVYLSRTLLHETVADCVERQVSKAESELSSEARLWGAGSASAGAGRAPAKRSGVRTTTLYWFTYSSRSDTIFQY